MKISARIFAAFVGFFGFVGLASAQTPVAVVEEVQGEVTGAEASMSPRLILYGLSPVFETTGRGKLVVERLDVRGERYDVDLVAASLIRGRFYDFARTGTSLKPGGIYAASLGSQRAVFLID